MNRGYISAVSGLFVKYRIVKGKWHSSWIKAQMWNSSWRDNFGFQDLQVTISTQRIYHPLTLIPNLSVEECLQKNLFFTSTANEEIFKNTTRRTSFVLKIVMISWFAAQAGN